MVERFANKGLKIVLCDLESSNGLQVASSFGDNVVFVPTDVTSADDVKNALKIAKEKFGGLDVTINCAGTAAAAKVYDEDRNKPHDLEEFIRVLNV